MGVLDSTVPLRRFSLSWGAWSLLALLGCADRDFQAGAGSSACTPGELRCVCDERQECEGDLMCIADRCIDIAQELPRGTRPGTGSGQQPGASSSEPSGRNGDVSIPEEGSNTAQPSTPEPDPSTSTTEPTSQDPSDDSSTEGPVDPEKAACSDGVRNFRETDADCGGPTCEGCVIGERCRGGIDCQSQVCSDGRCVECETDPDCDRIDSCSTGTCSENRCKLRPKKKGSRCDDKDPCTAKDRCDAKGKCVGKSTLVLDEPFDNKQNGWKRMYANREGDAKCLWEIGTAKASNCGGVYGEDPGLDHTRNGHNGVAGVVIGGCQSRQGQKGTWDCIWSKGLKFNDFEAPAVFSFWSHLHSPASKKKHGVSARVVYMDKSSRYARDLETGFSSDINDGDWNHRIYELPADVRSPVSVGICYQKLPGAPTFAGWSIDDVKVRQRGCMMKQ